MTPTPEFVYPITKLGQVSQEGIWEAFDAKILNSNDVLTSHLARIDGRNCWVLLKF